MYGIKALYFFVGCSPAVSDPHKKMGVESNTRINSLEKEEMQEDRYLPKNDVPSEIVRLLPLDCQIGVSVRHDKHQTAFTADCSHRFEYWIGGRKHRSVRQT